MSGTQKPHEEVSGFQFQRVGQPALSDDRQAEGLMNIYVERLPNRTRTEIASYRVLECVRRVKEEGLE